MELKESDRIRGELDRLGPEFAEDGIVRTVLRKRIEREKRRETFYGQELDCPDEYLTEWHSCPQCQKALYYCDCPNVDDLIRELKELYSRRQKD